VAITLNENEQEMDSNEITVTLRHSPVYILIKMQRSMVPTLLGLECRVIPLLPMEHTFVILDEKQTKTVIRRQMPLTPSYALMDYCSWTNNP